MAHLRAPFPLALSCALFAAGVAAQQNVTIHRDNYGVPHVFATSDRGAFYGAGYAAAQDRLFQMHWMRLRYQGRTAEFFGPGNNQDPRLYVEDDKMARRLGYSRHAHAVFQNLPAEHRTMLEHYADGVNQAVVDGVTIHPNFAQYGVPVTPWTPEDCIGVWYQFAELFQARDFDEVTRRLDIDAQFAASQPSSPQAIAALWDTIASGWFGETMYDNAAASVQQADVAGSVQADMLAYATQKGVPKDRGTKYGTYTPSFSEALAIGGAKVDTGHSVLVGMPRIQVVLPNVFHEFHMVGRNFNVRGAAVAGTPFLVVGSSSHCAWSATALGMDMSDSFLLKPSDVAGEYQLDGVSTAYQDVTTEPVFVAGGATEFVVYRRAYWGPVVTEVTSNVPAGYEVAMKGVPFDRDDTSEVIAFLGMYRAKRVSELYAATQHWRFPSANLVFAGPNGTIGYTIVGAIPVRASSQELPGLYALDGHLTANDWQDYVPHNLRPHVLNPASGYTANGNSLPIGSWYPLKSLVPGVGDTNRSRVLRDVVERTPVFQESALLSTAPTGALNPFVQCTEAAFTRDIVDLGAHLQATGYPLSANAITALSHLVPWRQNGARMDVSHYGVAVAHFMNQALMPGLMPANAPGMEGLFPVYGGRQSGMSLWLREARRGLTLSPPRQLPADEAATIDWLLDNAWRDFTLHASSPWQQPTSAWAAWYQSTFLTGNLLRWKLSVVNHGPLQGGNIPFGPQLCRYTGTLADQRGASFNQIVPMRDPDASRTLLALGQSEHDGSPFQLDQLQLWNDAALKPMPMKLATLQAQGITSSVTKTIP
ncbi:MAG: penicillin acylase family protein [Planctomycetes bacterium]|nr:penicillin acylase family protein [Planctomycetota bacterium]